MKPSFLIGAVLAVVATAFIWHLLDGNPLESGPALGAAQADRPALVPVEPAAANSTAADRRARTASGDRSGAIAAQEGGPLAPAVDPTEGEREAGRELPSAFRLIDGRGDPVAGAPVSWCAPPEDGVHARRHEAQTVVAHSDEAGRVLPPGFGQAPEHEALVWITPTGHLARWVEPGADAEWTPGTALILEEAPRIAVRVSDRSGEPIEGAEVVQRGLSAHERAELFGALPGSAGTLPDSPDDRALACLERRSVSDEEGRTAAFPARLPTVLWAKAGKRRSAPVQPAGDGEVLTLILDETFEAHGTVWSEALMPLARVLGMAELLNGERRFLGSSEVAEDGSWGPLELPLVGNAERFVFRVEGGGFVPLEELREPPSPRALLTVEFRPEQGQDLLVRLVEQTPEGKVPIPHGRATVSWIRVGAGLESARHVSAWTDEQGNAVVRGTPTTSCRVLIKGDAQGFVASEMPTSFHCPSETLPGTVFELALERAGRIRGRCLREGEPVEDFKVIYWNELLFVREVAHFSDREDGSFEISTAPVGEVTMFATAGADLAQSAPTIAEVTAERDTEVLLEVAEPTTGVGSVLDALTGEPIPDARVDPQFTHGHARMGSRGRTFGVNANGSFEVACFDAGVGWIIVSAPGYAQAGRQGSFRDGRVDFGVITLSRPQKLRIELVSSEPVPETGLYLGTTANGQRGVPFTRFPPNGILEFEDVAPGYHTIWLGWPGGDGELAVDTVRLSPGREWVISLPFEQPEPVIVKIVTEEGRDLPPEAALVLRYRNSIGGTNHVYMGDLCNRLHIPDPKRIEVPRVFSDDVTVEVFHTWDTSRVYASVHERFAPGEPRIIRVPLFGPKLEVRVVDGQGKPVRGARVSAIGPDGLLRANEFLRADSTASFQGLSFERVSIFARHDRLGISAPTVVELSSTEDTFVELEFDFDDDLVVRLMDGSKPIAGAPLTLGAPSPPMNLSSRSTDSDGRAIWERLGHGTYRIKSMPANCWSVAETFEFDGDQKPRILQVRRLANLSIEVLDADGQGVAGMALDLHSADFDTAVSTWVADNRVQSSTGAVVTGEDGTVLLSHLPRGAYLCRVSAPGGSVVHGEVDIAALTTATLHLTLP